MNVALIFGFIVIIIFSVLFKLSKYIEGLEGRIVDLEDAVEEINERTGITWQESDSVSG